MVGGAAGGADPAACHALHDLLVGDFDGDHSVEGDARLLQGLCLGNGAGHPVEDEAVLAVCLGQTLGDHPDDHLIGDQLAGIHIRLGLQANGSPVFHRSSENVAGGDGGNAQFLIQDLSLGAFPGARRAQKNQFHTLIPLIPGSPCSAA